MSVTFNDGVHSPVTVGGIKYPYVPGESYPMIVGRTMGGGLKVADLGDGSVFDSPEVPFEYMSDADHTALRTFFVTTVNFAETAFTYTDPNGGSHTNMHYVSGLESFRQEKGRWFGKIVLAKDMAA